MLSQPFDQPLEIGFECQGVYAIRHDPSGRLYVGSSVRVRVRLRQHRSSLEKGLHHSCYLQRVWDKEQAEAFTACLLEQVIERDRLVEREQYWIDRCNAYVNGFNSRPKAESFYGMEWRPEQNAARSASNRQTWADPALREKLSRKFKGKKRGMWTEKSFESQAETLKERHRANPQWRWKIRKALEVPENEARRVAGVRRSLKNPRVYSSRVTQLRGASQLPSRLMSLREAYFKKHDRSSLGISSSDELDQLCLEMYAQGGSLREIGRTLNMDHKSIGSRLRRLGVAIERTPKVGSALPSAKLTEDDVREIRRLLRHKMRQADIAKQYGVSSSVVSEIHTGKAWNHVKD